ncbi:MAG: tRNA uridine-5-carboxymethylaminomethyl(34) synthesis GTPase MnmE [Sphingomonadaceae bacterium]|nr:tRNA uridine-5-carboxymethylaminomethyl(34) synthesis GTPase MnmE [Sphingomonadaceae bacterium]MCP5384882.1 tRNA uridine-5-carboxymethylaminomethyl(34) synthesis GTPase MnmE [Altererythrobacter sp.]MCP5390522.1 tRNA uridine-5-carboxymethylaminomethyl(34) synthesis GTPase MnmE [Sphingomonadaceae bacterium]MCP5392717.1 tRNA uridine-5-carboxymethylaminomethyl(34) synthesis GTPase MnmE [Sphingomonadaceae bacterium]
MDTIFALSSGRPPAAIAVVRVSGPGAGQALETLGGPKPAAREAKLRVLRDARGEILDRAMVLWLPGPDSATGEDTAELFLHGGAAVIRSVESALALLAGLRKAEPGEFTRRAFANGRIDLAEAEGLAELLEAETELQRRHALAMAGGALSRQVDLWRDVVLDLSAQVESALDFSDEDDVDELPAAFSGQVSDLASEIGQWLDRPRAERLREGYRVVLAGPPNAGKSTLFNALIEDEAAIATPIPGTTRDVLERSVSLEAVPFTFVDTAGLRDASDDEIEIIGIERARAQAAGADCVLWLGPEGEGPDGAWEIATKLDLDERAKGDAAFRVSAIRGDGMDKLRAALIEHARKSMPAPGSVALNARQADLVAQLHTALVAIDVASDPLIVGENLRSARRALDALVGRTSTEDMLDALFGRFCIGK